MWVAKWSDKFISGSGSNNSRGNLPVANSTTKILNRVPNRNYFQALSLQNRVMICIPLKCALQKNLYNDRHMRHQLTWTWPFLKWKRNSPLSHPGVKCRNLRPKNKQLQFHGKRGQIFHLPRKQEIYCISRISFRNRTNLFARFTQRV